MPTPCTARWPAPAVLTAAVLLSCAVLFTGCATAAPRTAEEAASSADGAASATAPEPGAAEDASTAAQNPADPVSADSAADGTGASDASSADTATSAADTAPDPAAAVESAAEALRTAVLGNDPESALERWDEYNRALEAAGGDAEREAGQEAAGREIVDAAVARAFLLIAAGQFDRAGAALEEAVEIAPDNPDVWYGLSLVAEAAGDTEAQRSHLEAMIGIDPANAAALAALGTLEFAAGEADTALALFSRSLETDPVYLEALVGRASILTGRGDLEEAAADLSAALRIAPEIDWLWAQRGRLAASDGRTHDALADLDRAVELNPASSWNYLDRGRVRYRAGLFEQAEQDFTRALEIDPDNFLTRYYRALSRAELGGYGDAASDFRIVLDLRPDYYPAYAPAAAAFFRNRDFNDARRYFTAAALSRTGRPEDYLLAALSGYYAGDRVATDRQLSEWMPRIPADSILTEIARYYLSPGPDQGIIFSLQRLEPGALRDQAYIFVGAHFLLEGKRMTALALLTEMGEDTLRGTPEGALAEWLTHEYERQ